LVGETHQHRLAIDLNFNTHRESHLSFRRRHFLLLSGGGFLRLRGGEGRAEEK
jgi:hypothetical protein